MNGKDQRPEATGVVTPASGLRCFRHALARWVSPRAIDSSSEHAGIQHTVDGVNDAV
jgi:hypothetical protein